MIYLIIFIIGMTFGFFIFPICLWIEYKIISKKYGKEEADKIIKKWL